MVTNDFKAHIYLIYPREFATQHMPVYKIGRTEQCIAKDGCCKRLYQYPKGTIQLVSLWVNNCVAAERDLISKLVNCSELIQRKDFGREYFEGSANTIRVIMGEIAMLYSEELEPESEQIDSPVVPNDVCKWCMKCFSSKPILKRHIGSCKQKDNEIRLLEMETNTEYIHRSTYCRFCQNSFTQSSHLQRHLQYCKSQEIYKLELIRKLEFNSQTHKRCPF
jgi:hypothetical protein